MVRDMGHLAGAMRALALVLAAGLAAVSSARAESLSDALVSAYKTSGLLEQNRALLRVSSEDVAVAVSALYPVLSYAASTTYTNPAIDDLTASLSLNAELAVYDGGRNRLAIEAAKTNVRAVQANLTVIEQQVLGDAVVAYFDVLAAREFLALRDNNLRLITRELRAAQDRFEVGEVTRTDVSLAEARLSEARSQLAAADGQLDIAREVYRRIVGRYPNGLSTPRYPALPAHSLEEAVGIALSRHPQIRQSQLEVSVAEINVRRALANRNPTLRLNGSISASDQFAPIGSSIGVRRSVGLTLSGPIYQGGQIDALYRQAVAREDAARAALRINAELIRQSVGTAWAQMLVARAQLDASRRRVVAQQSAFDGVREEARLGARTTLDVLDAEQDLLDARVAVVDASADTYVAAYNLLAATGLLTARDLGLPVQTYDEDAYLRAVRDAPVESSPEARALDRIIKKLGRK